MPDSTLYPSSQANNSTVGTIDWELGFEDVFSDNNGFVYVPLSDGEQSRYLFATGFSFAIPTDATITSIVVRIGRKVNIVGVDYPDITMTSVRLLRYGALAGDDQPGTGDVYSATEGVSQHGDQLGEDGLWGLLWGGSDINDVGFGVAISASASGGIYPASAEIDYDTIQVNYTVGSTGVEHGEVQVVPWDAWQYELERPGESFVGHQPTDGAIVVDTSATEQGYTPTELPGDWGEEGRGDWYATLPQGVEVVVSSAVDSVPAFAAPLPDWEEVGVDTYALTLDPQTIAGATCECTGTLAFDTGDESGTIAFDGVVVIEFETTEELGPYGTISVVDGCGTIAFDDSCEC